MSTLTAPLAPLAPRLALPARPPARQHGSADPFAVSGPLVASAHQPVDTRGLLRRLGVLALAVVLALTALLATVQARSVAGEVPPPAVQVVVQPGDTVWQLAAQHRPAGMSTQDYAMVIVVHNDVDATALVPGSVLDLPTSAAGLR